MTKLVNVFMLPLILFFVAANSQNKVEKITTKDGIHYITTTIDYPITGTYLFEGLTEPMVQLDPDGTGVFKYWIYQKPLSFGEWNVLKMALQNTRKALTMRSTRFGTKTRTQVQKWKPQKIGQMLIFLSIFKKRKC